MHILELLLQTNDLIAQKSFYTTTLGLPLQEETTDSFTVQPGATRLTFQETAQQGLSYHLAFTIPRNSFAEAKSWIGARVPLVKQVDIDEFAFESWNAHSLYFYDSAGNILEFIAHHDLPNDTTKPFSSRDLLHISEIGLVVDDVPAQVAQLKVLLGIEPYKGHSAMFAPLGDIYGLFITVARGRAWFPTTTHIAVIAPVHVTIRGMEERHYTLSPYPYEITVAPPLLPK